MTGAVANHQPPSPAGFGVLEMGAALLVQAVPVKVHMWTSPTFAQLLLTGCGAFYLFSAYDTQERERS